MTIKPVRPRHALSALAALSVLAGGCTSTSGSAAPPAMSPPATSQTADSVPSSPPSPSASVSIPALPPAEPGATTLTSVPLRSGGTSVASFSARPGDLFVTILCTGGTLILRMDPVSTTTIVCAADAVTPTTNNFRLSSPKDINVSVEAPEAVLWNMRIEQ
ncbi:hypothetical protein ACIRBX_37240 [Kitasatospora sp. NPDC096147]|uniref:hypothetical protein n=1 Tax=Kitasatospora sp. NPDC096147 TaxID=3364093 RepID=UPI003823A963